MKIQNLISNITDTITNKISDFTMDGEKVRMVSITKLKYDEDFKALFTQEEKKVNRISEDMIENGFDKSQPIIVTTEFAILDGNSRYQAALKAGIKTVPIVVKEFADKNAALIYEYKLQLNRRNLTDDECFEAFKKLDVLKGENGSLSTDDEIASQLNVSRRQVSKMREVNKKASNEVLSGLKKGTLSINAAYNKIKEAEKPLENKDKTLIKEAPVKSNSQVDSRSFALGVKYALEQIEAGKTKDEILKNQRMAV